MRDTLDLWMLAIYTRVISRDWWMHKGMALVLALTVTVDCWAVFQWARDLWAWVL